MKADVLHLSDREKGEFRKLPVLWENDRVLVVDKPAGLPVRPSKYFQDKITLIDLIRHGIESNAGWAKSRRCAWLAPVHDLDQEATGVLVLAKDKETRNQLKDHFNQEQACLVFHALVQGNVKEDTFAVDLKVAPRKFMPWLSTTNIEKGKKAITHVRVLERLGRYTLIECVPLTWQHHQIRVHLSRRGYSLVGDKHYGGGPLWLSKLKRHYRTGKNKEERPLVDRPALHSAKVRLPARLVNPTSGSEPESILETDAPLAKDFKVALKFLRTHC